MKKWTMNANVTLKNLVVDAFTKEEAIHKIRQIITQHMLISEIEFDENNIKIDKKSIVMSEE